MNMNQHPIDARHLEFQESLSGIIPHTRIYTDILSRYAYSTDASFYRYIPQIVIRAENEQEIIHIIEQAKEHEIGLTFRAIGTSLSGQSCSESVLVLLGEGFNQAWVLDNGEKIKLQPMVIGAQANAMLAPLGRKIGPDPATINVASVGGIAANNASGMCCGTKQNSYHTLDSIKLILADGTILDTADESSVTSFKNTHASFLEQLTQIRDRLKYNIDLAANVTYKYRMKNTTGYGINALLDFDDPIDILSHLMIGSEGTLAFISEITYQTIIDHPNKASAFVFFNSLDDCCQAVTTLRLRASVEAVELFDGPSLRNIAGFRKDLPEFFYTEISNEAACLLIETKAADAATLHTQITEIDQIVSEIHYADYTHFQTDPTVTDLYWNVRKGLLPMASAGRPKGSNMITEDIVFPIERLAEGVRRLNEMFAKHGYHEGAVMGHALEGNLHFILTPKIDCEEEKQRYNAFMQELAQMVAVEFGGSLKGEHGTGRNIAPFVRTEWGDEAYQIMRDIKTLFDPNNILNPDVIITDKEDLHLQAFKAMPEADDEIDDCIECGFCESVCPSNNLTLSPRQRITIYRRIKELGISCDNPKELHELQQAFKYRGIDTCAATGMCATRCPLGINTGTFIKKIKPKNAHPYLMSFAERNIGLLSRLSHLSIRAIHAIGVEKVNEFSHKMHLKHALIPIIPLSLPQAAPKIERVQPNTGTPVVYFVSCVNRTLAEANLNHTSLANHTLNLFKKAGYRAIFPKDMDELCCGQPFESASAKVDADRATISLNAALVEASNDGEYPIYLDNSPCALRIIEAQQQGLVDKRLKLYHAADFMVEHVLPKLKICSVLPELALHIPCSVTKMGGGEQLIKLADACAQNLIIPDIACCGSAGIKSGIVPELAEHSLRNLKQEIGDTCSHGVSMSKLCQISLSTHSGINYQSIEALLDECSQ